MGLKEFVKYKIFISIAIFVHRAIVICDEKDYSLSFRTFTEEKKVEDKNRIHNFNDYCQLTFIKKMC